MEICRNLVMFSELDIAANGIFPKMLLQPFCVHCFAEIRAASKENACAGETGTIPALDSTDDSQASSVCTKKPIRTGATRRKVFWHVLVSCSASQKPKETFQTSPIRSGYCPPLEDRSGSGRIGSNLLHCLSVNSMPISHSRFFIKNRKLLPEPVMKLTLDTVLRNLSSDGCVW